MKTLVTGANGFIGSALSKRLIHQGLTVRGTVRTESLRNFEFETVAVGPISSKTDWSRALKNIENVIHLAAHVHVRNQNKIDSLAQFRSVNVDGTVKLAEQAANSGVKRFVYLSSIKVNGEFTQPGHPFRGQDVPAPADAYGVSKLEAEQALEQIANRTGMEVVIIRPPLVYGPGVKANFHSLLYWFSRGVPLPLAGINKNQRSLVALDNLIDLIVTCLTHQAAANKMFLVSDSEDISTAELLNRMGVALGKPSRLFYVPPSFLRLGSSLLKKEAIYQRLCESLQVDIHETQKLLAWTPPISLDEGLRRTVEGFLS